MASDATSVTAARRERLAGSEGGRRRQTAAGQTTHQLVGEGEGEDHRGIGDPPLYRARQSLPNLWRERRLPARGRGKRQLDGHGPRGRVRPEQNKRHKRWRWQAASVDNENNKNKNCIINAGDGGGGCYRRAGTRTIDGRRAGGPGGRRCPACSIPADRASRAQRRGQQTNKNDEEINAARGKEDANERGEHHTQCESQPINNTGGHGASITGPAPAGSRGERQGSRTRTTSTRWAAQRQRKSDASRAPRGGPGSTQVAATKRHY